MKNDAGEKPEVIAVEDPMREDPWPKVSRINPRLVFTDPDAFFGRDLYHDLLLEQQEQM